MNLRAATLLGLGAIGCSLVVPLDYTGGKNTDPSHTGGSGGIAGSIAPGDGGTTAEGGSGGDGGSPEGGAPEGGAGGGDDGGSAGSTAEGGMAAVGGRSEGGKGGSEGGATGQAGSTAGEGAMSGAAGRGGSGGLEGGMGGGGGVAPGGRGGRGGGGGRAGGGGMSGMSGMSGTAGNAACPTADLMTDEDHCGTCTTMCEMDEECLTGVCRSSPCDGLCDSPVTVGAIDEGYKVEKFNSTAELCYEIDAYEPSPGDPSITCWNFDTPRILEVNGVVHPCASAGIKLSVGPRVGGYCVQASAGNWADAGFVLPAGGKT